MTRVDQVIASASPGDAVTDFALALRATLSGHVGSEIFAVHCDPGLSTRVRPLGDYARRARPGGRDVVVYHLSIGAPDLARFVDERSERIVLVYHNISPPDAFRPYDPTFSELLDEGRRQLAALVDRVTATITFSEFNANDLRAAGYRQLTVLPLVVGVSGLRSAEPDRTALGRFVGAPEGPVILSVGQLLPHKRPDFVVEAFHILSTYLVPNASLLLTGPVRLPAYGQAVQTQIDELHVHRAVITGAVRREELVGFFRGADLFVTASEHEGFCVPLLEAMAFDLPIVARRFGAVPETAGDAALLLDPADGPAVAAETIAAVLEDPGLQATLVGAGRRRLADFDAERATEAWRDALLALV
jgi:glycosyltransferase involved in cell wall biosynthesis